MGRGGSIILNCIVCDTDVLLVGSQKIMIVVTRPPSPSAASTTPASGCHVFREYYYQLLPAINPKVTSKGTNSYLSIWRTTQSNQQKNPLCVLFPLSSSLLQFWILLKPLVVESGRREWSFLETATRSTQTLFGISAKA